LFYQLTTFGDAERPTAHGREDYDTRHDDMPPVGEWLVLEEVILNDLSADIVLQRD